MGIHTSADEKRDKAEKALNEAIKNLSEIVVDKVSGWDDYKKEFYQDMKRSYIELIDIRDRLFS